MRRGLFCLIVGCVGSNPAAVPIDNMIDVPELKSGGVFSAPFSIDRDAVSARAFSACIEVGACRSVTAGPNPLEDVMVSWADAYAYCRWRGARLPTNLELVQAESSLRVDGQIVWAADLSSEPGGKRLVQHLESNARWWNGRQWPPPGLDARSEPAGKAARFRCARSSTPRRIKDTPAFIRAGVKVLSHCSAGEACTVETRQIVPAFLLDRAEVTNSEYAACVEEGVCASADALPLDESDVAARASFSGAAAFCKWRQARLPTAVEWESAARSGDARVYPWGNQALQRCADVTLLECGNRIAVGSGARDVTEDGVFDMAGGADEWVTDTGHRNQVRGRADRSLVYWLQGDADWHGFRCAHDL